MEMVAMETGTTGDGGILRGEAVGARGGPEPDPAPARLRLVFEPF